MGCYKNLIYGPTANATTPSSITNAIIPTTGKPRLRITPIYGDDGVQIAYYENTITIDTVIYINTAVLGDIEAEVKRLTDILSTPGYTLVYYPIGLGTQEPVLGPLSQITSIGLKDVKGGPYPQDIVVEPVASNNAIAISFSIMFRTINCSNLLGNLIQFNCEIDFDVDDDGDLTFNLRATLQRINPITDISSLSPLVDALVHNGGTSFPGMRRRKRTSLTRDQRTANIHVEYKQIKSESAFYVNTRNIQLTDDMSSSLLATGIFAGKGFMSWNRKLSATITLPPRIHKSWAWIVYLDMITQRLKHLNKLGKLANILGNTSLGKNDADQIKNFYILTDIRISNDVYSRSIKFETSYYIVTDLKNMLEKSQIFNRIDTAFLDKTDPDPILWVPKTLSEQWQIWTTASNDSLNGTYEHEPANLPIVYNQCAGTSTFPKFGSTKILPNEDDFNFTEIEKTKRDTEDAKYSWLDYKNRFSIEEETNNIVVNYLQPIPEGYYKSTVLDATATGGRDKIGHTLSASQYPLSGTIKSDVISRGTSQFKLRMKGYAIRVSYKPSFPVVTEIAGQAASRTDDSEAETFQISQGEIPVYMSVWNITYVIPGDIYQPDIMKSIKTNGDPGQYS